MASSEFTEPSEEGDLALRESQYRVAFDGLIPDAVNRAGESEKVTGIEWMSDDWLEAAYLIYGAIYEDIDENDTVRTTRSGPELNIKRTDPITGKVDQLIVDEDGGSLFVTEFRGMPSVDDSERAEQEFGLDDYGAHPLAVHVVEECLIKNNAPATEGDLTWAMEAIRKMKQSGIITQVEDNEPTQEDLLRKEL